MERMDAARLIPIMTIANAANSNISSENTGVFMVACLGLTRRLNPAARDKIHFCKCASDSLFYNRKYSGFSPQRRFYRYLPQCFLR